MSRPSLLAFFAHPDDEAFSCGGTLAAASARGWNVTVVSATTGEAGQARDGTNAAGLGERRLEELAESCRALGAQPPRVFHLADGGLAGDRPALRAKLIELFEEVRFDVAVTMGSDGAYGHLDHVVCSEQLTHSVAERLPSTTVLHVVFPPGYFDSLRKKLRRTRVPLAPGRNEDDPRVDYVVDIEPFRARKLASVAAHRSQLDDGDPATFLSPGLIDGLLGEERFRHVAGPALHRPITELFRSP